MGAYAPMYKIDNNFLMCKEHLAENPEETNS